MKSGVLIWLALLGVAAAADYFYKIDELYNSSEDGVKPGKKSTNCTCGLTNKERIVGGRETLKNEYPLMAAIVHLEENFVFCGASIITEYHALTASHCLVPFQGAPLALLVGSHDITKKPDKNAQLLPIKQAIEHDDYRLDTMVNDIALLVTAARIKFNKVIGPACLPTKDMNLHGEFVKVIGWGYKKHEGQQSATLQKVNLKIVPVKVCSEYDPDVDMRSKTQLCATLPHRDSCEGDSGGPMLWNDPETNRLVQVGVVSKGTICGEDPGVYTNVASYLPWIQAKIAETRKGFRTCAKA